MSSAKIDSLRKRIASARAAGKETREAELCFEIGELLRAKENFAEAVDYFERHAHLSEKAWQSLPTSSTLAKEYALACRLVGDCYSGLARFEEAIDYNKKYLGVAKKMKNRAMEQEAMQTLGNVYLDRSRDNQDASKAEVAYRKCLQLVDRLTSEMQPFDISDKRCRLYYNLCQVTKIRMKFEAQKSGEAGDGDTDSARTTRNGASQLEEYCEKAIKCSTLGHNVDIRVQSMVLLAETYYQTDRPDEAKAMFEDALEPARTIKDSAVRSLQMYLIYVGLVQIAMANGVLSAPPDSEERVWVTKQCKKAYLLTNQGTNEEVRALQLYRRLRADDKIATFNTQLQSIDPEDTLLLFKTHERYGDMLASMDDDEHKEIALEHYSAAIALLKAMDSKWLSEDERLSHLHDMYTSAIMTHCELEQYVEGLMLLQKNKALQKGRPAEASVYLFEATLLQHNDPTHSSQLSLEKIAQSRQRAMELAKEYDIEEEMEDPMFDTASNEINGFESIAEDSDPDESMGGDEVSEKIKEARQTAARERALINRVNKRNDKGETALHSAVISGDRAKVVQQLGWGAKVVTYDFMGWTPIHEAANHGHVEILSLLLETPGCTLAAVNAPNNEGVTPLHDAAMNGYDECVRLLLDAGATRSLEHLDRKKQRPLDVAIDGCKQVLEEAMTAEGLRLDTIEVIRPESPEKMVQDIPLPMETAQALRAPKRGTAHFLDMKERIEEQYTKRAQMKSADGVDVTSESEEEGLTDELDDERNADLTDSSDSDRFAVTNDLSDEALSDADPMAGAAHALTTRSPNVQLHAPRMDGFDSFSDDDDVLMGVSRSEHINPLRVHVDGADSDAGANSVHSGTHTHTRHSGSLPHREDADTHTGALHRDSGDSSEGAVCVVNRQHINRNHGVTGSRSKHRAKTVASRNYNYNYNISLNSEKTTDRPYDAHDAYDTRGRNHSTAEGQHQASMRQTAGSRLNAHHQLLGDYSSSGSDGGSGQLSRSGPDQHSARGTTSGGGRRSRGRAEGRSGSGEPSHPQQTRTHTHTHAHANAHVEREKESGKQRHGHAHAHAHILRRKKRRQQPHSLPDRLSGVSYTGPRSNDTGQIHSTHNRRRQKTSESHRRRGMHETYHHGNGEHSRDKGEVSGVGTGRVSDDSDCGDARGRSHWYSDDSIGGGISSDENHALRSSAGVNSMGRGSINSNTYGDSISNNEPNSGNDKHNRHSSRHGIGSGRESGTYRSRVVVISSDTDNSAAESALDTGIPFHRGTHDGAHTRTHASGTIHTLPTHTHTHTRARAHSQRREVDSGVMEDYFPTIGSGTVSAAKQQTSLAVNNRDNGTPGVPPEMPKFEFGLTFKDRPHLALRVRITEQHTDSTVPNTTPNPSVLLCGPSQSIDTLRSMVRLHLHAQEGVQPRIVGFRHVSGELIVKDTTLRNIEVQVLKGEHNTSLQVICDSWECESPLEQYNRITRTCALQPLAAVCKGLQTHYNTEDADTTFLSQHPADSPPAHTTLAIAHTPLCHQLVAVEHSQTYERYLHAPVHNAMQLNEGVEGLHPSERQQRSDFVESRQYLERYLQLTILVRCMTHVRHLSRVNLSHTRIDDTGVQVLVSGLGVGSALTHVQLSGNLITATGVEFLSQTLSKLCVLDLSYNLLTDLAAPHLARILHTNNATIQRLRLDSNFLSNRTLSHLSTPLVSTVRQSLQEIGLSGNAEITVVAIVKLIRSFDGGCPLTVLSDGVGSSSHAAAVSPTVDPLSHNSPTDACLSPSLIGHTRTAIPADVHVSLRGVHLTDESLRTLLDAVASGFVIRLNLSHAVLPGSGLASVLQAAVATSSRLEQLDLSHHVISDADIAPLQYCVKAVCDGHSVLTKLDLSFATRLGPCDGIDELLIAHDKLASLEIVARGMRMGRQTVPLQAGA
ncbi:hypothetical protein, variant 2 [Sphaeroforma arctica JP610]|uniref:Tonsoku-like protein n=1 Tax=Sphaeroforma arctica JP610 TaxID=667725 RepID=A0A0L0GAU9_9EUKA|nr:hypothetical protein, variant 2 [Sphaeroforma arctica JP610]KNC85393.1 hypothetical protein, variant 2 [Sphaeroforma arctica JP610]|eukprot:XP_014159297.1 hypothetical protein, variant 2 [Sphaeroforma arctica JP610]